ncbi:MAG: hypothetical protein LBM96_05205 [Methanobrevibacter sp.]|nr:hypothetical protein [Candidatus Methanoflexus mossambicus]
MSKDGFENEHQIVNYLNKRKFKDLNQNMTKLLNVMFKSKINNADTVYACKITGVEKSDICIKINDERHFVSVKKGSGNSIHQEKLEVFIDFLKKEYNLDKNTANSLRFYIWGDGTIDGTGEIKNRLNARELKKNYPKIIEDINNFFNEHKEELISRFLIKGTESVIEPDYIYYGTCEEGIGISINDTIEWLLKQPTSSIGMSKLTFQAWNRNIKGGNKTENRRGVIQLKWGSIANDLNEIWENKYG